MARRSREVTCPYCGKSARLTGGNTIYPHIRSLWQKRFWWCGPCNAYVGCHGLSDKPLGRLANAELRKAKREAHAAFDPMWQSGKMKRSEAYKWLSEGLGVAEAHIGEMDVDECNRVRALCMEAEKGAPF